MQNLWDTTQTTLFASIANDILHKIRDNQVADDLRLPSERELALAYGASIGTVRKAIDLLEEKGVVFRKQGKGTFVSKHSKERYLFSYFSVTDDSNVKVYPIVQFDDFQTGTDKEVGGFFQNELLPFYLIKNHLLLNQQKIIYDQIYLPMPLFKGLDVTDIIKRSSTLYTLYDEKFKINITNVHESLSAVCPNEDVARVLAITREQPVLKVVRKAYSFNTLVEVRIMYVNTEKHHYNSYLLPK